MSSEETKTQEPTWTTQAARLLSAGWREKVRSGKRIWAHPETSGGFWYSEAMAYQILERNHDGV